MKKNYVQPATTVVSVATESIVAQSRSVKTIQGGMLNYGGAGNSTNGGATARVKEDVYDVWDDDWSE